MEMDVLAVLMVAFCLFAILMFILFYIYARKYYNEKKISDDYTKLDKEVFDDTPKIELIDIMINGKNYVFDANNHVLNYNDVITLNINGLKYSGVVTKSNYKEDLSRFEQIPTKLILEGNSVTEPSKETVVDSNNYQEEQVTSTSGNDDFTPKKKDEML